MRNFNISTDDTSDFTAKLIEEMDLHISYLHAYVNGVEQSPDNSEKVFHEFYDSMRDGASTKSSQANRYEIEQLYTEMLLDGKDILHLAFSNVLSGQYKNCFEVAKKLNSTNKNQIYVIDTTAQSGGQALLVKMVCDYADEGHSIEECVQYAEENKSHICHLFVVDKLTYLARNGRISNFSAFIGNVLAIKPVLYTNTQGKLIPLLKILSRKASLRKLVELMKNKYDGDCKTIYITHGDCYDDARFVAHLIENEFNLPVTIMPLDYTIGAHSGPGTVALFFTGKNRDIVYIPIIP
ncbi:MAG: DegV family protein [Clostridia bacterium]